MVQMIDDPFYSKKQSCIIGIASAIAVTGVTLLVANLCDKIQLDHDAALYSCYVSAGCGVIPLGALSYYVIKNWPKPKPMTAEELAESHLNLNHSVLKD